MRRDSGRSGNRRRASGRSVACGDASNGEVSSVKQVASGVSLIALACALSCTPTKVTTPPSAPPAPTISLDQKRAWVMRLEQQRVVRDPAEPAADLIVLARDKDVFLRRQAMLAL